MKKLFYLFGIFNTNMRNNISMFFLVISHLSFSPMVNAQFYTLTDDDVIVTNGIIQSCSYSFEIKDIIIPSFLDGQIVIGIADMNINNGVFKDQGITSVSLPSTIEFIGNYSFYWNEMNFLDLTNCSQLTRIGNSAFKINDLETLDLSACISLSIIGEDAFFDNKITILDLRNCGSISTIKNGAFESNKILSLNMSYCIALKSIEDRAFYSNQIESMDLSNCASLVNIGQESFYANNLYTIDLNPCLQLKNIGKGAFFANKLTSVILSANSELTNIGKNAFADNNLYTIDLSNNNQLKCIGEGAFSGNTFSNLILPVCTGYENYGWIDNEGNTYAGGDEIYNLSHYYIVDYYYTLSAEDLLVEDGTIVDCFYDYSFKSLRIPSNLSGQPIIGIGNVINNDKGIFEGNEIVRLQLSENLEEIGSRAFMLNDLISLDLSICPNIKTIGFAAFQQNKIKSLDLTNCFNLKVIDHYAFLLNQLHTLDLSPCHNLEYIGNQAFAFNDVLTNINFNGCPKLKIIDVEAFSANDLRDIDLSCCPNLKVIGWQAFLWNEYLTHVNLEGCISLTKIDVWAFSGTSLTGVDLSSCTALATIGLGAFDDTDISSIVLPTPNYPGYVYWQDNNGNIFNAGDAVSTVNGYTAYDVFTPVTFTVTNNGVPVDSAAIAFYDRQFFTNQTGMLILPNILQGTYTYTVSAQGFENATGEVTVGVDSVSVNIELWGVGVNEIAQAPIRIYPNPGNDHLNISLPSEFSQGNLEMYNISGRLIIEKRLHGKHGTVYTGQLPAGIYLYRIYDGDRIIGSGKWVRN